jgi:hypothetical protein
VEDERVVAVAAGCPFTEQPLGLEAVAAVVDAPAAALLKDGALALAYALILRFLVDLLVVEVESQSVTESLGPLDMGLPGASTAVDDALRVIPALVHHIPGGPSFSAIIAAAGVPVPPAFEPIDAMYHRRLPRMLLLIRQIEDAAVPARCPVAALEAMSAVLQNLEPLGADDTLPAVVAIREYTRELRRYAIHKCTATADALEVMDDAGPPAVDAVQTIVIIRAFAAAQQQHLNPAAVSRGLAATEGRKGTAAGGTMGLIEKEEEEKVPAHMGTRSIRLTDDTVTDDTVTEEEVDGAEVGCSGSPVKECAV